VSEDVRSEILKASLELIDEGGLGGFSMREAARRAHVSHQAPYHYFADRESILAELVRDGFEQLYARMSAAADGAATAGTRLAAMGEAYISFAIERSALFRLMFREEMVDIGHHLEAKAAADRAFHLLAETVLGQKPPGAIDDPAPIIAVWSLAHGLASLELEGKLRHLFGERTPVEWKQIFSNVLQTLMPKNG
jgi:AcrR family transcriptional regulator